jgi:hypothetical protein
MRIDFRKVKSEFMKQAKSRLDRIGENIMIKNAKKEA